jgi:hypothetical protein
VVNIDVGRKIARRYFTNPHAPYGAMVEVSAVGDLTSLSNRGILGDGRKVERKRLTGKTTLCSTFSSYIKHRNFANLRIYKKVYRIGEKFYSLKEASTP